MNKILKTAAAVVLLVAFSGCGIYKKYETPQDTPITRAYAEARAEAPDSTSFGSLLWEDVFTDPILAGYINTALTQNTSLRNAMLNVDIARAQLRGARLSFLPSVALAPNGAGASYAGSDINWTYQLPVQVSWEIDIFGKLLNSKRGAQESFYLSEAYARAARSQIISAVANTYYGLSATRAQLALARSTAEVWKETVSTMEDFKLVGNVTEAAVVQSRAQYYSILATITDLEQAADNVNNTLCLLLNMMPGTVLETAADVDLQVGFNPSTACPCVSLHGALTSRQPSVSSPWPTIPRPAHAPRSIPDLPSTPPEASPICWAASCRIPATGSISWPVRLWLLCSPADRT